MLLNDKHKIITVIHFPFFSFFSSLRVNARGISSLLYKISFTCVATTEYDKASATARINRTKNTKTFESRYRDKESFVG